MSEFQFLMGCLLVVIPSLITYFVMSEKADNRLREMERQYKDALETLGQANAELRRKLQRDGQLEQTR